MPLTSFCGLVTLQVGASVLAAVFFTLAGVILAANIFDYSSEEGSAKKTATEVKAKDESDDASAWPFSIIVVIIFVIGLIIAGILSFFSSYNESRSFALMALFVILLLFIYWLILCVFSFLSDPDYVKSVCIYKRCPETFWLANLDYRSESYTGGSKSKEKKTTEKPNNQQKRSVSEIQNYLSGGIGEYYRFVKREIYDRSTLRSVDKFLNHTEPPKNGSLIRPTKKRFLNKEYDNNISALTTQLTSNNSKHTYLKRYNYSQKKFVNMKHPHLYFLKTSGNSTKGDKEESRFKHNGAFFAAIALFIINFLFFVFAAVSMWSWAQELDWADYYVDDPYYYGYGPPMYY